MRRRNVIPFRRRRPPRRRAGRRSGPRGGVAPAVLFWAAIWAVALVAGGAHQEIYARVAHLFGSSEGCRVTGVVDGDTVRAYCPGAGGVRVRLLGFDAPETWSPSCAREAAAGARATAALRWRVFRASEARLTLGGSDRYGRRLGRLHLDGEDVARAMIADGLARPYGGGRRAGWC